MIKDEDISFIRFKENEFCIISYNINISFFNKNNNFLLLYDMMFSFLILMLFLSFLSNIFIAS
jgi:hypothetical protein